MQTIIIRVKKDIQNMKIINKIILYIKKEMYSYAFNTIFSY